jgi:tRNA pseudouridine38-40 synthase
VKPQSAVERLKITVAYDGSPFDGWQSQAHANGVQDHIEAAFLAVGGIPQRIHGSGRTDAGVHATGQVAHVDVPRGRLTPATWAAALNANLPLTIRIIRVSRVRGGEAGFHARFTAKRKRYTYRLWNASYMHPLEVRRAWHVPRELDLALLRQAAALLIGRHDFARFTAKSRGRPDPGTVRTLHSIGIRRQGPLITLTFEGDGFLYKMVRLLTGTIIRVAEKRAPLSYITDLLSPHVQTRTHFMAVAEGLYLTRVFY